MKETGTVAMLLGIWLCISAFLWPHSQAQQTNTWLVGALGIAFSAASLRRPQLRYVDTLLAIWLFISAFALRGGTPGTIWNNAVVAIALFVVSLIVPADERPRRRFSAS